MNHIHTPPIPAPTPSDLVSLLHGTPYEVSLHGDGWMFFFYFAWSVIGITVYLYGHGLAPRPRPLLAFLCGPAAWMAASWKVMHLAKLRIPPALHSKKPPVLKHWEMPNHLRK